MGSKNSFFKDLLIILSVTFFIILIVDYLFGKKLVNYFFKEQIFPEYSNDSKLHHKLLPNFKGKVQWKNKSHSFCTNFIGSKIICGEDTTLKNYDYALIGDSFIEGIGLSAKENISGYLSKSHKDKKIINLSVRSYSNIIYLEKIKYLIDNKLINFKELILFPDLSDIQDDSFYYKYNKNYDAIVDQDPLSINRKTKNKLRKLLPFTYTALWLFKESIVKKCDYLDKCFVRGGWAYNSKLPKNSFLREKHSDELEQSIKISLSYAEDLFDYLKKKKIELSVVVYPWPGSLLYDNTNSKHVEIWKNFCKNKCKKFVNTYDNFFELKKLKETNDIINEFYMTNDVHFNSKGSKFISDIISKKLIR